MVPRCSQSVPARLNQRACSWHITDWRLWHDGTSDERPNEGWKLSASLFIKKEVGLRIIWNGLGWVELLQKLWREQLAALNRHWIIWSGVTARSIRVLRQFAASTLLEKRGLPPGPNDPSWIDRIPSKAPGVPAGSFQDKPGYLEWSHCTVHQGPQAVGCRECPAGRLKKRYRTTRGCGREAFAVGSQTVTTRGVSRLHW